MKNKNYCRIQTEIDLDGKKAVIVADDQFSWTCWLLDYQRAVELFGDESDFDSYELFCNETGYLKESSPESHAAIVKRFPGLNYA